MSWFVAVLVVLGLVLMVYPSAASWVSKLNQLQVVSSYNDQVNTPPADQQALDEARSYNELLEAGVRIDAGANIPTGEGTATNGLTSYESMLQGPHGMMSRVRIPTIDVDLPIYHGTDDETLLRGAGHLEGTSLPVGGMGSHSFITAHRGLAEATMFSDLNQLVTGDRFTLETFGEMLTYQVSEIQVIDPDQTEVLAAHPERDLVTLVTCTPLGVNTHRIIVTGERVFPTPLKDLDAGGQNTELGFPWWALATGAGITVAGAYVWRSGKQPNRK